MAQVLATPRVPKRIHSVVDSARHLCTQRADIAEAFASFYGTRSVQTIMHKLVEIVATSPCGFVKMSVSGHFLYIWSRQLK